MLISSVSDQPATHFNAAAKIYLQNISFPLVCTGFKATLSFSSCNYILNKSPSPTLMTAVFLFKTLQAKLEQCYGEEEYTKPLFLTNLDPM